jgi:hypothetical protein
VCHLEAFDAKSEDARAASFHERMVSVSKGMGIPRQADAPLREEGWWLPMRRARRTSLLPADGSFTPLATRHTSGPHQAGLVGEHH